MWTGEGWHRTQRQLGSLLLIGAFIAALFGHTELPIAFYTVVGGLLGLDILVEALDRLRAEQSDSARRGRK